MKETAAAVSEEHDSLDDSSADGSESESEEVPALAIFLNELVDHAAILEKTGALLKIQLKQAISDLATFPEDMIPDLEAADAFAEAGLERLGKDRLNNEVMAWEKELQSMNNESPPLRRIAAVGSLACQAASILQKEAQGLAKALGEPPGPEGEDKGGALCIKPGSK
mmetsp:Transcript_31730/g.49795  ORF Transcript_31730/g.49795 Transcript_31730/m.49795 type:complete len:167 (+) Transcript_31730:101-601(+)